MKLKSKAGTKHHLSRLGWDSKIESLNCAMGIVGSSVAFWICSRITSKGQEIGGVDIDTQALNTSLSHELLRQCIS